MPDVALKIVVQVACRPTAERSVVLDAVAAEEPLSPLANPASTAVAVAATATNTAARQAVCRLTPTSNSF
jgi:hypothetical protein